MYRQTHLALACAASAAVMLQSARPNITLEAAQAFVGSLPMEDTNAGIRDGRRKTFKRNARREASRLRRRVSRR